MNIDRTHITLFIAFIIAIIIGISRPSGEHINSGLDPDHFWVNKAFTEKKYDLVLAGDSRVYRGLSPEAINRTFPDLEIINYGFSGNGYNREYLEAISERVKTDSKMPVIILGISTMSLTEEAAKRNDFLQLREKSKFDRMVDTYLSRLTLPFRPIELYRYYLLLKQDRRLVKYFQDYHEDGWVSGYKIPDDPDELLASTRQILAKNKVAKRVVDLVNSYTRKWTEAGIRVFAFRLPTTKEMVKLEDELSQFDKPTFVKDFSEAGGKWLDFEQDGYHSYDGSHLHRDAAISLSKDLAAKLEENGIKKSLNETED